jgi:hypothetical protein
MPDLLSAGLYKSTGDASSSKHETGSEDPDPAWCSPSIFDPLPAKPSRMHRRTYQRLLAKAESADASLLTLMEVRFGPITGLGLTVRSDGGSVKMAP